MHYSNFLLYYSLAIRDLHSFPTRRSSDLKVQSVLLPLCSTPPAISRPSRSSRRQSCVSGIAASNPTIATGIALSDRKSTRLNSSHVLLSYAVFCSNKNTPQFTPPCTHKHI